MRLIKSISLYIILLAASWLFMIPILWMFSSSFQDLASVFVQPYQWIPQKVRWENYVRAVSLLPFARYLMNTLVITGSVMIATAFSCSLVAFGFSRLRFRGRDVLFTICLATMMLPGQVTLIPLYMLFAKLGWIDTYLPLIVPSLFGTPFYIFLLRQFFLTLPCEYDEAALIDGASRFRIFWSVILPQSRPVLTTVLILTFIGTWNDFFGPLIYINSPELATLTLGLNMMKTQILGSGTVEWNVLMAASLIVMLPNIIIFFFAQKQIVKGMSVGVLK